MNLPGMQPETMVVTAPVVDRSFGAPARHVRQAASRSPQPLRESTGNAQQSQHVQPEVPTLALCTPSRLPSPTPSAFPAHMPPPTIVSRAGRTRPLPTFGTGLSLRRETPGPMESPWRVRNKNPFYDHPQFRQYRNRQDQKEEKDGLKWPPVLEDAFLDALLLIPDMGRSKYFMHQSLHGRNMIISMYVWMAYCMSLPPGVPPDEATHRRDRKAISSHIQVLKAFFKEHRFFHFFFPTKDEQQRRSGKRDTRTAEARSLKNNPVLVALAEGRFPNVRPNYEYFAHLLSRNSTVTVRPKTCWEFVSSSDVLLDETGTLRDRLGNILDANQYPHLAESLQDGDSPQRGPDGSILLHEYTRSVSQTFSTTTKDILKLWETNFPGLYEKLDLPEPQDEDALTILEMTTTLELHKNCFPSGSELNGLIEMAIALPSLQTHNWRCVTRLVRPKELCSGPENEALVMENTDEVVVQYTHQPGCGGRATNCGCMSRPRQDIRVPFPAAEWASMLTKCASYPEPPTTKRRRRTGGIDGSSPRSVVTRRELVAQIAMLQELWSVPPHGGQWTRQAVILWRFRDVHQYSAKKKEWAAEPAGTSWRFLTVNDPASAYHMNNAFISLASVNGDVGSSGQIPSAEEHGNLNVGDFPPWSDVSLQKNQLRALGHTARTGLEFGHFHHGITTPPSTGTHPSSYASSLDSNQDLSHDHQLNFLSAATACDTPKDSQTSSLLADMPYAGPFISATAGSAVATDSYEDDCDATLQHWDVATTGLEAWTPGQYGVDAPFAAAEEAAIDWDGGTARDWDRRWSLAGMDGLRAWDEGPGHVSGVGPVSPTLMLTGSADRYSLDLKYSPAETGRVPTPSPPLKTEIQGIKRERTDSLDFECEGRKTRRLDGVGMREDTLLRNHSASGAFVGRGLVW